jgi:glycosyltransferase involved in cell wall biosynthesis
MTGNKKIVIVSYENFPYGGAGANFVRYLALALVQQSNDVQVVLPTGNIYGTKIEENFIRNGNIENVNYNHLGFIIHPQNAIGKFADHICGFILPIFYLCKENFKKRIDTLILYNLSFFSIVNLIFIKKILGTKLVLILPEFYEKPKSKFISTSLIIWHLFYFGLKNLSKYADSYIVLSHFMHNYLQDTLKIKKNIFILPNLVDPDIFNLKLSRPFINNKITIGYTGTPTRKDGIIHLINSFGILIKKYPNTHLLIIGDVINGKSVIPDLKYLVNLLNLNDDVTFTGLVSIRKIPVFLNSCQILALTRPNGIFAEAGFPTKLGEYFACRKPVLTTRFGDISFYFRNEEHMIIVNPEDIQSIVIGFEKLINDNELCDKMCNNAYNWMDANLNYKNVSNKLSEFISNV